jgi:hypothetical protein
MKRIVNTAILSIAVVVFSVMAARDAGAKKLTLNFVQAESFVTVTGGFQPDPQQPEAPFFNQEGTTTNGGVVDLNPARPSNSTTFQGTIKVDVDNVNNPLFIRLRESNADADAGGNWFPRIPPEVLNPPYEFVGPSVGTNPGPSMLGDIAVELRHPTLPADLAYAVYRDIHYNITTLGATVPVLAGQFLSSTVNFEFGQPDDSTPVEGDIQDPQAGGAPGGWFDYWANPGVLNERGRSDQTGGDDDNESLALSSWVVTMLPNNKRELKLTIPAQFDNNDADSGLNVALNGQFVATLIVPEPSTFLLSSIAMAFVGTLRRRRRD